MSIEISGEEFFTMKEFAEKVNCSYSYIRKCVRGIGRSKDLQEYVVRIEDKPLLKKEAEKEF